MQSNVLKTRRGFLTLAGTGAAALVLPMFSNSVPSVAKEELPQAKISPTEDLMREHGILRRVLLIYEDVIRRMKKGADPPAEVISGSADMIRRFIEHYHEKLEENEVFPRFKKAGKFTDLVKVLTDQHQAGRRLTDVIMQNADPNALAVEKSRNELIRSIQSFVRMYRPHAAREDTVLFPSFRGIFTAEGYDELGENFEQKEQELFGKDGFSRIVEEVAGLEKKLGIYDLEQFTPKG